MTHGAFQHRKDKNTRDRSARVLVCDDEPHFHDALKSLPITWTLLKSKTTIPEMKVVGETSNGQEAIQMVAK